MYWEETLNTAAMEHLKNSIEHKIRLLFEDRRDVLFDVKRGFT